MLKGFKEFLLRGNVIDLAVAVVIGAAFTAVVTAFTKAFLEPLLRLFSGGEDAVPPGTIPLTDEVQLDYAAFLNAIIQFMITAAVIYFLVVYPMKWLQERRKKGKEEDTPETDSELLKQIRDLLEEQSARERERTTVLPPADQAVPAGPAGPLGHGGPAPRPPMPAPQWTPPPQQVPQTQQMSPGYVSYQDEPQAPRRRG
ncbi:Large-conductance mechanosensitive channel [Pseudonocardia sp. Ae168_Ps1]|uniref:large-conductance mechanosensitive channel protein MscL n=1 Tax=unclassified Pseudonocardia TaxID=2619320 RepID=UPI0001FFE0D7|nr:Large-conductance mechanosensitive channel [Pseudonocardia sp. Ae150A_Ps1]OLL82527.1 Large-conductance mechanosensitive channel [Pseudonocardia sp. Ae168_Ps1]OLL83359.1 Large-conductance mechanosensitive channel [Pseudonocardia sp. Ae263_Ps1]OLL90603.1 Large-conductance mechanosensitive channel [Pseudonocardia sp. Ae356_Ps1]OLM15952.1 Large-conductance mechanosensitive channel [Pseudonocardia sp. Ae707_Ps1]